MSNFQNDQAAGLRRIMAAPKPRVVSIISAATNHDQPRMMTNLAATICCHGSDVLIVHASENSRESSYNANNLPSLFDVANESHSIEAAIASTPHGFSISKLMQKNQFNIAQDSKLNSQVKAIVGELVRQYEIVLVDATLNENNLLPLKILNQGEIIVQLTRRPESIKQAYTLIKQICSQLGRRAFGIVVEDASDAQAQIVFNNIAQVARRFMQIELEFFGAIPNDDHLNRAAKLGRSVIDAFPMAAASSAFKQLAERLDYKPVYCKQELSAANNQASFI
ncbi:MAG: MotR [Methylotenera sp.]